MPRLTAIKNFTANADLSSGNSFFRTTNFGFQPTEAVVRQISYLGPNAQEVGNVLVWCSITNDFIGCFNVGAYGAMVNPQTQILLTSPLQNQIQFQIEVQPHSFVAFGEE